MKAGALWPPSRACQPRYLGPTLRDEPVAEDRDRAAVEGHAQECQPKRASGDAGTRPRGLVETARGSQTTGKSDANVTLPVWEERQTRCPSRKELSLRLVGTVLCEVTDAAASANALHALVSERGHRCRSPRGLRYLAGRASGPEPPNL